MQLTECTVGGGQTEVTVGVSVHWDAFFLAVIGFGGADMVATATAIPDEGDA
ncbi:hypothetical protein Aple_063510 [Acrocarpospora pleiomorpha]|uniref:Uncharacterized protein n=1 Tax=Acrocarpospora pleiomorpha TaxID=90975 RepID=A0A5M3XQY5_9ACTN|nr:hypothetical protein Aple_063510 [Acrocarpospora pleiomorpha]